MSLVDCLNLMKKQDSFLIKNDELHMLYLAFSVQDNRYKGTVVLKASGKEPENYCREHNCFIVKHTYFDGLNLSPLNSSVIEKRYQEISDRINEGDSYGLYKNS